jgi:hypothetical protein
MGQDQVTKAWERIAEQAIGGKSRNPFGVGVFGWFAQPRTPVGLAQGYDIDRICK